MRIPRYVFTMNWLPDKSDIQIPIVFICLLFKSPLYLKFTLAAFGIKDPKVGIESSDRGYLSTVGESSERGHLSTVGMGSENCQELLSSSRSSEGVVLTGVWLAGVSVTGALLADGSVEIVFSSWETFRSRSRTWSSFVGPKRRIFVGLNVGDDWRLNVGDDWRRLKLV